VSAWRERVADAVRSAPENQPLNRVVRLAGHRDPAVRARAFRAFGARRDAHSGGFVPVGLEDPVPAVRRAAAWALGWRRAGVGDLLLDVAAREPLDAPRWTMAVAAVRCGAEVDKAWMVVSHAARRVLQTFNGPRSPAGLVGVGANDLELLWMAALSPGAVEPHSLIPVDNEAAREAVRARVSADPEDRQALLDLAVFEHPGDLDLLLGAMKAQGRRMRHTAATAIGINGDPRGYRPLVDVLRAIDVDPGHGFAGRSTAAKALGWLGVPRAGRPICRAITDEALDHEGRPGAGLGIQRPVRSSMLYALGELGDRGAAPLLAGYLGNIAGTATGGLYLPAMDALVKLRAASDARALLGAADTVAANALGVLGAMGHIDEVEPFVGDQRPVVAAVAQALVDA